MSFFAASMRRNLIDLPSWRKSRGALQDIVLPAQDLVLASQAFQFGCRPLLTLQRRSCQVTLPAFVEPAARSGKSDAEILGDLALRASARPDQTNVLCLEQLSEPAPRLAREIRLFPSDELSGFEGHVLRET